MKKSGRPPQWVTAQIDEAVEAYALGLVSTREAQKRYGIPPSTLLRHCRSKGIEIRKPGLMGVKGESHPKWKGGYRIDKDGYVRTYAPNHPFPRRSGYVHEHVRMMELAIGRKLKSGECVHHKDNNRQNNDLSNLEIKAWGEHSRDHRHIDTVRRKRDKGRFA